MLPRASMLRTKKLFRKPVWVVTVLAPLLFTGCGDPGPKALLHGDRLVQKGQYAQAVKELKTATEVLPRNARAWNHLGLAYHGNRQPEESYKAYKKALQVDYKLGDPHFNLGCLLLEQSKPTEAADELLIFTTLN